MSRQNKQAKKAQIAQWVRGVHKNGNKVPSTKKLSTPNKGKCIVLKGKRVSLSSHGKQHD